MSLKSFHRPLLFAAGAVLLCSSRLPAGDPPPHLVFGDGKPFSYDILIDQAKTLAKTEYVMPVTSDPDIVEKIDYLVHGDIRFRQDASLWIGDQQQFALSFFHVGRLFRHPIEMYLIKKDQAYPITAQHGVFEMPENSPAAAMKPENHLAGFKIQEDKDGKLNWKTNDWVAFLGASYFRSIGELYQYGLSARGITINTANPNPPFAEEFPIFRAFWIDSSSTDPHSVTVYALLDGPSVTGAYRFVMERRTQVIMTVDAALFVRKDITRFGLAPLTSMYWFSETAKPAIIDWRPEVHDSDGLAILKGNGESIWRPLNDPERLRVSSFVDESPKGFGLMQRDRDFRSYIEDGAYERRPSLWVEPLGDWGKGSVELVEIPTRDESDDNIVAFWVPEKPATAGSETRVSYRLIWGAYEPDFNDLGRCVATRLVREPRKHWAPNFQRFIVEFSGGPLDKLPLDTKLDLDLWAARGHIEEVAIIPLKVDGKIIWRIKFALYDYPYDNTIEMRLYLKKDNKALTETWLYQFNP